MNEHRGLWRGKDVAFGEWVEGDLLCDKFFDGSMNYCIFERDFDNSKSYTIDPETLGECTGLRDKNGKLIFEGDILKAIWQHLGNADTVIGIVKYNNAAFFLETDDHYLFFEDNIFSDNCDAIGNIHDNPELLQEGAADELYRKENKL